MARDVAAVRSVACRLTELEQLWCGRIARIDELLASGTDQEDRTMPVPYIQQDLDTLTITAEFAVPVERIWQVYADPHQLERVWGPPTHLAAVVDSRPAAA
jgi:hypothetical protein